MISKQQPTSPTAGVLLSDIATRNDIKVTQDSQIWVTATARYSFHMTVKYVRGIFIMSSFSNLRL